MIRENVRESALQEDYPRRFKNILARELEGGEKSRSRFCSSRWVRESPTDSRALEDSRRGKQRAHDAHDLADHVGIHGAPLRLKMVEIARTLNQRQVPFLGVRAAT